MFGQDCKRRFGASNLSSLRKSRRLARLIEGTPGDLMFLNAFGQPVVVLQSFKAAFELLQVNKCADISSDRPRYILSCGTVAYSPPP
jgi:hypothetical protein